MWPDQENLTQVYRFGAPLVRLRLCEERGRDESAAPTLTRPPCHGNPERALRSVSACAETVRSPPKPGRHGEETVQPTNACGRRRKPKWEETGGRRFKSCRGYFLHHVRPSRQAALHVEGLP